MKRRVLFVVLIGISLILAVVIYTSQAVHTQWEEALAKRESLSKSERDRFDSNAFDFYRHDSKTAQEERKRLRNLYYKIQSDPERERLLKTLDQYVDWVDHFGDPATMRDIQSRAIDTRVKEIQRIIQDEQPVMFARSPENIRESLPLELRDVSPLPVFNAFDDWLTQKYHDAKAGLTADQLEHLPTFEKFYGDLFRQAGMEPSSTTSQSFPVKLAMIHLIQNLSPRQERGGGSGGGPPPGILMTPPASGGGSGNPGLSRLSMRGGPPFGGRGLREEFFEQFEPNQLDQLGNATRQALGRTNPLRFDTLQKLLALAVMEQYPAMDQGRFSQAVLRKDQEWVKLLGDYLSMMTHTRREEFLKQDSRYTSSRLQNELVGNARGFFDLLSLRSNRDRPGGPSLSLPRNESPLPPGIVPGGPRPGQAPGSGSMFGPGQIPMPGLVPGPSQGRVPGRNETGERNTYSPIDN